MADIKQMSFMLLILLVSVSALYETMLAKEDDVFLFPAVATDLGVGTIDDFNSTTLTENLNQFQIDTNSLITTVIQIDLYGFVGALSNFFGGIWSIFMKLMFGWTSLISAIFASIGLQELETVFIAPLVIIQIIAGFYFLRDLVNTIRGVG